MSAVHPVKPAVVEVTAGGVPVPVRRRTTGRLAAPWRAAKRHPLAAVGALLLTAVFLVAVFGPWLVHRDPWESAGLPLTWPGQDPDFPLGTDAMGRDLLAGLASGAWVSLLVGLTSTAVATLFGLLIGGASGYFGGWVDNALGRVTELFQTVPKFVLAVVLVAVLRPSVASVVAAIATVSWPPTARLVRSEFMALREREFVLAARTLGMGPLRLVLTQILPNALPPVLAVATLSVATAIQTEAALAFLGLGDPNVMSWGSIIGAGREQVTDAWYICLLPGAAIVVTVLGFTLLGEGLNDAMNPHLRER